MTTNGSILSLLGRRDIIIVSHKKDCMKLFNQRNTVNQDDSTTVQCTLYSIMISVAEPHNFYAAPAPPPAPTLLYTRP
jgi:hypothetical protein